MLIAVSTKYHIKGILNNERRNPVWDPYRYFYTKKYHRVQV